MKVVVRRRRRCRSHSMHHAHLSSDSVLGAAGRFFAFRFFFQIRMQIQMPTCRRPRPRRNAEGRSWKSAGCRNASKGRRGEGEGPMATAIGYGGYYAKRATRRWRYFCICNSKFCFLFLTRDAMRDATTRGLGIVLSQRCAMRENQVKSS